MASSGSPPRAVVFVQGSQAPGAAVSAFLSKASLSLEQLTFACATQAAPSAQFQTALLVTSSGSELSSTTLSTVAASLEPGASIYVTAQDASHVSAVQQALLLGGFLDSTPQEPCTTCGLVLVQAKKPSWERGAKAALTLKRPVAAPSSAPVSAAQAWKLSAANEDEDMVDEDELLTAEDKQALPAVTADASDCSTSKKACKNCSCGRAEAEAAGEKVQLTQAMLDNPQTNCGSCALGDAFRCAGCPYRGLPAFEPGKKITLGTDFLTADA